MLSMGVANAQSLTPIFKGATTAAGVTTFLYEFDLTSNTIADSATSITFFDFRGLTGTPTFTASAAGASFAITTPLTGPNPTGIGQTDDGTLANAGFIYSGTPITNPNGATSNIVLGSASIQSVFGLAPVALTAFEAHTTQNVPSGGADNQGNQNGPNVGTAGAPEPGSVALFFGVGAAGAAFLKRRRNT
jgi:hypothetical protein